jgi:hypothetical protein
MTGRVVALFIGAEAEEGRQSGEETTDDGGVFMAPITGGEEIREETVGWSHFSRGREAAWVVLHFT